MYKEKGKRLEANIKKIHLINFLDGLWFPLPIYLIYLLDNGITLTQVGVLFGAGTLISFLLEIPSSIWADKYSRKNVLLVNGLCSLLAHLVFFFSHSFIFFLLGNCLMGIAFALNSGTYTALFYDTLLSLRREKEYEQVQSRVLRNFFAGRLLASLFGAYIYLQNPRLIFLLAALVNVAYIIVITFMVEPFREKSISTPYRQVREGLNFLRTTRMAWKLIVIFSLMVAASDVLFDYYQPALRLSGASVLSLGVIYFFVNLLGVVGASLYMKVRAQIDWKSMMILFLSVSVVSSLLLGSQYLPLVLLAITLLSFSFSAQDTFIGSIINQKVPSTHRATSLSIQSQLRMLFYAVLIALVGFFVDRSSLFFGLFFNAAAVFAALLVFSKFTSGRKDLERKKD